MVEAKDKKSLHLQHLEKLTFRERRALCQYEIDKITVKRSATNPFFNSKYSTLDDLYNVIQGPLEKQGLFHVFKFCSTQNGNILKLQILDRVSDEFEESCLTIPESVMEIAQNFGSFTTYQKRYMISANFGISCPETDEDGNIQVPQKNPSRKPSESSPKKDNQSTSSGGEDSQSSDREYWFKEPYLTKLDDIKFLTATDKDRLMGDIEMGLKKVEEANPQVELTEADLEEDKADDIPF